MPVQAPVGRPINPGRRRLLAAALAGFSFTCRRAPAALPERPRFHFTPQTGWMNDPNGLVFFDGEYHLHYQYHPAIRRPIFQGAGAHFNWGHAVSSDLVHWKHLPLAIREQVSAKAMTSIYSGSAIVDWENRSGFGAKADPPIVAFYTGMNFTRSNPADGWTPTTQPLNLAYSNDRCRSFTNFAGNPVIDVGERKFGDPKVFWYEPAGHWVLVAIRGMEQGMVELYGSSDLTTWRPLSEFHAPREAPGKWECPDLFPLPLDDDPGDIKWILKINAKGGVRYFIGGFDGETFVRDPLPSPARPYQHGHFYAAVTWNDIPAVDGRRIQIGWLPQKPREDRPWTGMQSIPRVMQLRTTSEGPRVHQTPVAEFERLRDRHYGFETELLSGDSTLLGQAGISRGAWEILAEFVAGSAECVGFRMALDTGGEARFGYCGREEALFFERPGQERLTAPQPLRDQAVKLRIFVDCSVVELFGGDGETAMAAVLDPDASCEGLELFASQGKAELKRLDLWRLVA